MASKRDKRKQAYRFVCHKSQQLGIPPSQLIPGKGVNANLLSPAGLYHLKSGLTDPLEQLVVALKSILCKAATDEIFDINLILPFRGKRHSTQ
ncbi:hypothetical protein ACFLW1_01710 [Chloroflexota bacterium]